MGEKRGGADAKAPELAMTRVFDAPRALVWEVWTKPEHLKQWFGPAGFTMPFCEIDLRPGGVIRFAFRGPDGREYPSDGEYVEIDPPARLVWKGIIHGGLEVWTEVKFEGQNGKTKLSVHQRYAFESDATRGAPIGWGQTLDHLASYLGTLRAGTGSTEPRRSVRATQTLERFIPRGEHQK
jgi:uncharacterized protein YndB with AHSA1/START domain